MEYTIGSFVNKLKEYFTNSPLFPVYDETNSFKQLHNIEGQKDSSKHPKRNPTHLKEATEKCFEKTTIHIENIVSFDLGSEEMEKNYPHYHILEDSPAIRKRGYGTQKTKGSQSMITNVSQRDYGKVRWNGKTFSKEYSRNVRGSRNRISSIDHWTIINGTAKRINRDSNSYNNIHYNYIENILNLDVVDKLALEFGMTLGRTQSTGLEEEYKMQENGILAILDSFR